MWRGLKLESAQGVDVDEGLFERGEVADAELFAQQF